MSRERETGTAEVNGRRYDMNVLVACNTLYKSALALSILGEYVFDRGF
jgi:hypothetical protein